MYSTVTKSYRDVIIPLLFDAGLEHVMRKCKLLGIEEAGRWRNGAASFTRMLAQTTARSSPPSLGAAPTFALSLLLRCLSSVKKKKDSPQPDRDLPPRGQLLSPTAVPTTRTPSQVEEGLD